MGTESADLQLACRLADLGTIEKLLQQRPESVNEIGESTGWAPLYGAVICRHVRVVKLLLDRGADPNQPTKVGEYPIHQAAESNQAAMLELLLQKGADPDVQQTSAKDYVEILQVLLRYSADTQVKEWVYGRTALHVAVLGNATNSACCLLQHEAIPTIPDSVRSTQNGKRPSDYAASSDMSDLFRRFGQHSTGIETSLSSTVESMLSRIDDLSRRIKDTVLTPSQTIIEPLEEVEDSAPFEEVIAASALKNCESRQKLFTWLTNLKLESCFAVLVDSGYDDLDHMVAQMRSSMPLSVSSLERVGIHKLGYRLRLLAGLELERGFLGQERPLEPCTCSSAASADSHSFQTLREWLADQGLQHLTPTLEAAGLDDLSLLFLTMNSRIPLTCDLLEAAGVRQRRDREDLLMCLQRDCMGVAQYRRYIPELTIEREQHQSSCQCAAM